MTDGKDDIIRFVSEDQSDNISISDSSSWKLIVADDDEEVHAVTALALSDFKFKNRPLEIISAYSAKETETLIVKNPDTAVILLDVVMENHDSGLQLVKFIREKAKNNLVRIILRTGQPGYAPELEVITLFDINDYKEKTELTSSKLVTTLISSLRNYNDLKTIEKSRLTLELISSTSAKIHGLESEKPMNSTIYEALNEVINSFSGPRIKEISLFDAILNGDEMIFEGGTGEYAHDYRERDLKNEIPALVFEKLKDTNLLDNIFFHENSCTIFLQSRRGIQRLIYLKDIPQLSDINKSILRTFTTNISTVYNNIELLQEQKKTEKEIRNSLDEKLILVKEIHHRVKNNLQIISSLLHMQLTGLKDKKIISILKESEDRVKSMSLVHEKLYQSDLMATIDFTEYIRSLAESLISSYSVYDNVELKIETVPLMLSINTAIPCGLIVNEILTNSIKYAFPGNKEGIISIQLSVTDESIFLKISDNGIGLPRELNMKKIKSLGLKLIQILTDQIDGSLEIESDKGTSFAITFSESEERES